MLRVKKSFRKKLIGFVGVLAVFAAAVLVLSALNLGAKPQQQTAGETVSAAGESHGAAEGAAAPKEPDPNVRKWAFIMAALAVCIGSIAGGGAVGYVGAAAMGAIGEKPELAGRALIFVGLAEGIAIARPVRGKQIIAAVRQTGGEFLTVSEDEIKRALVAMGRLGYGIEPTAAATIAGVKKYLPVSDQNEVIASAFTGHGLKATEKMLKLLPP